MNRKLDYKIRFADYPLGFHGLQHRRLHDEKSADSKNRL